MVEKKEVKTMAITKKRLNLCGWFSVIDAAIVFPILGLIMLLDLGRSGRERIQLFYGQYRALWETVTERFTELQVAHVILTLISLGLSIYIFFSLKKLLNSRFNFHATDAHISALIWISIVSFVITSLSSVSKELMTLLSILITLIAGVIYIVFAIRILRLPEDLFCLLKPFSYLLIATGICYVTFILIPLAFITGAVSSVILAMIFFRAAEAFA